MKKTFREIEEYKEIWREFKEHKSWEVVFNAVIDIDGEPWIYEDNVPATEYQEDWDSDNEIELFPAESYEETVVKWRKT